MARTQERLERLKAELSEGSIDGTKSGARSGSQETVRPRGGVARGAGRDAQDQTRNGTLSEGTTRTSDVEGTTALRLVANAANTASRRTGARAAKSCSGVDGEDGGRSRKTSFDFAHCSGSVDQGSQMRRGARYGLRGTRVGEACHPGPRSRSRSRLCEHTQVDQGAPPGKNKLGCTCIVTCASKRRTFSHQITWRYQQGRRVSTRDVQEAPSQELQCRRWLRLSSLTSQGAIRRIHRQSQYPLYGVRGANQFLQRIRSTKFHNTVRMKV